MNVNVKDASADDKQAACYHRLRDTLLAKRYEDRLTKPLGYWALPNDRRLPQALLEFPLEEVLARSFEELAATRGIGQKKIESLFVLLARAAGDQAPGADLIEVQNKPSEENWASAGTNGRDGLGNFNPGVVSEALWQQWQASVRESGVADMTIGLVVPSLDRVPSVIWQAPLSRYADKSLAEIRAMRTHGVKRMGVILQAFYFVHRAWQETRDAAAVRAALVPTFIAPIERWLAECADRKTAPGEDALRAQLIEPLLAQIQVDCGEMVAKLARDRIGLDGRPMSVRSQARRLIVTRARIYQIFEQCGKAMEVRWPEGRDRLRAFESAVYRQPTDSLAARLLAAAIELCYPRRFEHDGAA
ncbi:MAG: hypothetical protein DCC68_02500 [Planctomycetota bacterium]|nr:MAG: hypothetical protein DCC68_02500 [Planctomycetota bacterium]